MKRTCSLLVLAVGLLSQCSTGNYDPDKSLDPQAKDELMMSIVRYISKPPENVPAQERFDSEYDGYYRERASACRLERYYKRGDDQYFLVSQPAPSLTEKRHATGGKLVMNNGELTEYEEVFRTWKMVPDTLKKRSYLLFDRMVKGESLERYLTKNSMPVEFIEFPDDHTYFDKKERRWKTNNL